MAVHSKVIIGGHVLCWSDLSQSAHPTLIIDAHGAEPRRFGINPLGLLFLDPNLLLSAPLIRYGKKTFIKRRGLELNFIAPEGHLTHIHGAIGKEYRELAIKRDKLLTSTKSFSETLNIMEEFSKKTSVLLSDSLSLEKLLTNSFHLSETIPYNDQVPVVNYLLSDVMKNSGPNSAQTTLGMAMKAMRKQEDTYRYQSSEWLFDDMPSILLVAGDTDLETILNIPEVRSYKRVICTCCRGRLGGGGQSYYTSYREHAK